MQDCQWWLYLLFTLVAFAIGVIVCDRVAEDLGEHDYGGIVWDEVVGYLLTLFLAPPGVIWIILGFLLFRLLIFGTTTDTFY